MDEDVLGAATKESPHGRADPPPELIPLGRVCGRGRTGSCLGEYAVEAVPGELTHG